MFTLEVARDDPRLFDEVLKWFALNESLISTRRLRTMCGEAADTQLVDAVLAWVHEARGRRRANAARDRHAPEPLFHQLVAPIQKPDTAFAEHGLIRPVVDPSDKSQPPDLQQPINFAFRLRLLLGLGARAEVVRCLLTVDAPRVTAATLARSAGYAKRNVHEALAALRSAQLISGVSVGSEQHYSIDRQRWGAFLGIERPPEYVDWPQLLGGLRRIVRWLRQDEELDQLSDYMRASRINDLLEDVRADLSYAGVAVGWPRAPELAEQALEETIDHGLRQLGLV